MSRTLTAAGRAVKPGDVLRGPEGWKFQVAERGCFFYLESRRTFLRLDLLDPVMMRWFEKVVYLKRADGGTLDADLYDRGENNGF